MYPSTSITPHPHALSKANRILTLDDEAHLRVRLVTSDPAHESGGRLHAGLDVVGRLGVDGGELDRGVYGGGAVTPVGEGRHVQAAEGCDAVLVLEGRHEVVDLEEVERDGTLRLGTERLL